MGLGEFFRGIEREDSVDELARLLGGDGLSKDELLLLVGELARKYAIWRRTERSARSVSELRQIRKQLGGVKLAIERTNERTKAFSKTASALWVVTGIAGFLFAVAGASGSMYYAFVDPSQVRVLAGTGLSGLGLALTSTLSDQAVKATKLFGRQERRKDEVILRMLQALQQAEEETEGE